MKILILGDVMGLSGRMAIKKNLLDIIKNQAIDFTILNGENSADDGKGITKNIAEDFFLNGADVITSGNHIWDKKETTEYINKEKETRISLNVRFKNLFSPTGLKNQLQYYRPLNISNITKFGAEIDSKEKL